MNDKAIRIKAKFEIEIKVWGMQGPESLIHLIRELKFDK